MMRGDVEKMKKRKILARGILIMLVCSVGLIIAQENVNTKKRVNGYDNIRRLNNSELAEILERHGMIWDPETGCTAIGLTSEDLGFKRLPKLYNPADNKTFV